MSCRLLFVHGWGCGAGVWRPLLRFLPEIEADILDLGFFGRPNLTIPTQHPFIAVGHSLGFLWLLNQLDNEIFAKQCLGLISINGFSRFSFSHDFPHGIASRILKRMTLRLTTEPVEVIREFGRQSGLEQALSIPARVNVEALSLGLSWLAQWDQRTQLTQWRGELWALASEDDQIVTPALTRDVFAQCQPGVIHWLPSGGHLLPLTRPETCAALIADSIKTLP
ncbi:MAG: hypothetical protein HQL93_10175 [Magnetococcales bacterium]|nr:hypothetical protein [Magnetococcales bacterium]